MYTDPMYHDHIFRHTGKRALPNNKKDLAVAALAIATAAMVEVHGLQDAMKSANSKIDTLQTQAKDASAKLAAFNSGLDGFEKTSTGTLQAISGSLQTVSQVLSDHLAATSTLSNQVNAQAASQTLVNQALSSGVNTVNTNMALLGNQLQSLTAITNAQTLATQSALNRTISQIASLASTMNKNFISIANTSNNNYLSVSNQMRATVQSIRDITQVIHELYMNTPIRRVLTRAVMLKMLDVTNSGQFIPFLTNLGTLPVVDPSPFLSLYIENIRIMLMDSTQTLNELDIQFYCYIEYLFEKPRAWNTWMDFLDSMGPSTCVPSDPRTCFCYANITIQSCSAKTPSVTPSTFLSSQAISASMCSTGNIITQGPFFLNNPNQLLSYLSALCIKGTYTGSKILVAGVKTNQAVLAAYDSSICAMDLGVVMSNGLLGSSDVNFVYALFNSLQSAFAVANAGVEGHFTSVDGTIASNLTYTYQPFEFVNGQQATCTTASFMSFATDPYNPGNILSVPVYYLDNPVVSTDVITSVDGVTSNTYDVSISQTLGYNLLSEYTLVGDPSSPDHVYDVVSDDVSLSPFASAKRGHVTYNMIDDPTNFNMARWQKLYGPNYEHDYANNVISAYLRTLTIAPDLVTTVCNVSMATYKGTICNIMDYLYVKRFDDPQLINNPVTTLGYKTGSYTVKIPVPDGQIYAVETTGCPVVNVQTTNVKGVTLQLANHANTTISVIFEITGGCPYTSGTTAIKGISTFGYNVPFCGVASPPLIATIYKTTGAGKGPVCQTNISVASNRTAVLASTGMADLTYSDTQQSNAVDNNAAGLNGMFLNALSVLSKINAQRAQKTVLLSATINVTDLSAHQKIQDQIAALVVNVSQVVSTLRSSQKVNLTTSPYDDIILQDQLKFNQSMSQAAAHLVVLNSQLKKVNVSVAELIVATNISMQANKDMAESVGNYLLSVPRVLHAVTDAFTELGTGSSFTWTRFGETLEEGGILAMGVVAGVAMGVGDASYKILKGLADYAMEEFKKLTDLIAGLLGSGMLIETMIMLGLITPAIGGALNYYVIYKPYILDSEGKKKLVRARLIAGAGCH
jgi:hypothetical protein